MEHDFTTKHIRYFAINAIDIANNFFNTMLTYDEKILKSAL